MGKDNLIQDKSFGFAIMIIRLFRKLIDEREYVISRQILRSGTSIGANVEEAIAAESRKDFAHKISLASKEARETRYWLRLLDKGDLTKIEVNKELNQIQEIINITTSIVKTTKENS